MDQYFIFVWLNNSALHGYTTFFLHFSVDEYLGCYTPCLLWIMLLWTFIYKLCVDVCFYFPWIAGSYGNSMLTFFLLGYRCFTMLCKFLLYSEVEFPVLYSRFSLVIYFIHVGVYISIPIFQFIPRPPSPLGVQMFIVYVCVSISALHQTLFHSGCTILHSHKQCLRVPISLHSHHHLSEFIFFIKANLVEVKWYLIVVLIWISLMTNNANPVFMY